MAESKPAKQTPGPPGGPPSGQRPAGTRPPSGAGAQRPPRPPARPRENIDELKGQVSDLSKGLEAEREQLRSVDEKVASVEDRLKSLMKLSELLSVRYNPFLEESEGALFDERYSPDDLVARLAGGDARLGARPDSPPPDAMEPSRQPAPSAAPPPGPDDKFAASALREVVRPEDVGAVPEPEVVPPKPSPGPAQEPPHGGAAGSDQQERTPSAQRPPRPVKPPARRPPLASNGAIPDDLEARVDRLLAGRRPASPAAARDAPRTESQPATSEPAEAGAILEKRPTPGDLTTRFAAAGRPAQIAPATQATETDRRPSAAPAGQPGVRQSYLAIAWLEHLGRAGKPAALPRLLDYYHRVGWIDDTTHGWLADLASGMADPPTPSTTAGVPTWEKLGLKPADLARLHRRSLRFLELLRQGMADEDFERVEAAAAALLEEA